MNDLLDQADEVLILDASILLNQLEVDSFVEA